MVVTQGLPSLSEEGVLGKENQGSGQQTRTSSTPSGSAQDGLTQESKGLAMVCLAP